MKKILATLLILSTVLTACNKVEIEDFTGDYQYTHNEGRIFNVTVGPLRENAKGEFERPLNIVSLNVKNYPEILTDFARIDDNSFSCVYHSVKPIRPIGNGIAVLEIDPETGIRKITVHHERRETYIAFGIDKKQ